MRPWVGKKRMRGRAVFRRRLGGGKETYEKNVRNINGDRFSDLE